jgi:dephospho-CoA kinase
MLSVALTGGIATGKSYVRARFEALGVPTIDADTLARDVVRPGTAALAQIVARFGAGVLQPDGALDRRALGAVVFADPVARRALEAIVHPAVRQAIDAWVAERRQQGDPLAVADIPLLFETGRTGEFDVVVVTACPPDEQVSRIVRRDGLSEADARARVEAQMPIEEKVRRADHVVRTDGTHEETDRQVDALVTMLRDRAAGR